MAFGQADDQLVERARSGDVAAFAALYDDLAPRLLRFLAHHAGPELAEDLMQRTFLKIIEGLPRFETRRGVPFGAWAFRVARNVCIDEHRTAHSAVGLEAVVGRPSEAPGPEQAVEAAAERGELLALLERLPRDQHDVLIYRFFGGLSPREVAALMNKSEGSVRVAQHRALNHLRRLLSAPMTGAATAGARS